MKDLHGRVAVVTGAASGIGRGIAEALCAAGMKVVLSDVEAEVLEQTAREMRGAGAEVLAVCADVASQEQVEALGQRSLEAFGAVHVVCNNAGVGVGGVPTWESTLDDWNWILGVNLMGVVHGIRTFVPILLEQGAEGHVVNTASMAGLVSGGGNALYGVTKHAVVALSENLQNELRTLGSAVRVSVLCPGWVDTRIFESERNRPAELSDSAEGGPTTPAQEAMQKIMTKFLAEGLPPRSVGDTVARAITDETFYVLTHDWYAMVRHRMENILEGRDPTPIVPPGMPNPYRSSS